MPVQTICPVQPDCQTFIDHLYLDCEGVTLPDGYYFDPQWTIPGTWGDDVKREMRISVGRCGCGSGFVLKMSLTMVLVVVFGSVGLLGDFI